MGGNDGAGGVSVWLTFRSLLRRKWPVWLGLALLLGLAAGGVMGGVAGARRTASANERFREAHSAYDLLVSVRCREPDGTSREPAASRAACLEAVRQLPSVADVAVVEEVSGFIATADGTSVQPFPDDSCYSGPGPRRGAR